MAYRMAQMAIPLTLSFSLLSKAANSYTFVNIALLTRVCLHNNRKAYVACNLNCVIETEGLLKVTCSRVHCQCGKNSETVPVGVVYVYRPLGRQA